MKLDLQGLSFLLLTLVNTLWMRLCLVQSNFLKTSHNFFPLFFYLIVYLIESSPSSHVNTENKATRETLKSSKLHYLKTQGKEMKTLALVVAGILTIGASTLIADSEVNANENLNVNVVEDSSVTDSVIGTSIDASDSTVNANNNLNVNVVQDSTIEDSIVGTSIEASDSTVNANDNLNVNVVKDSEVSGSTIGTQIRAR
ncbi:MAG: Unknown protein [uncultured Sulfurovum sp.]|uniref:Uncharacterized protein n=1 Tax=uncultured Sulfurovum sp. TaxID=269237 RepID=A0A6S6TP51_9BACT|nr:MAG: Unknown protein [uncultured Sulfurovum sp.]